MFTKPKSDFHFFKLTKPLFFGIQIFAFACWLTISAEVDTSLLDLVHHSQQSLIYSVNGPDFDPPQVQENHLHVASLLLSSAVLLKLEYF